MKSRSTRPAGRPGVPHPLPVAIATLLALSACGRGPLPGGPQQGGLIGDGAAYGAAGRAGAQLTFVPNQHYLIRLEEELDRPGLARVDILQFNFYADHGGDTQAILEKLVALKQKGVAIRVFLEGTRDEPKKRHADTVEKLTRAGIEVRLSKQHTVHTKAVCFDGKRLLVGSTNWTVTSWNKNNETNALLESATLGAAFTAYFERLWGGQEAMQAGRHVDGQTALLMDTAFYDDALDVIGKARSSLDIGTYFLAYRKASEAGDAKVKALLDGVIARNDAAKKAGKPLRVRFFLDNNGIRPELHKSHTLEAAWHAREYLVARGVEEVWFDRYEQISHCKFIIRDAKARGEVLFGSTNLYVGDFDRHHQLNVRTSAPAMVKAFARYMDERLAESSQAIRSPGGGSFRVNVEGAPALGWEGLP